MGRAKKSKTPAELSQTEKASQESPAAEKQNSESISVSNAHSQRENPPAGEATATLASTPAAETPPANNDYLQEGIIDGRYQILSILGKGGMGTVFLTKHLVLNRIRAVKVLHPHLCSDGNAVIRFRNEAAAVSALEHANIIAVHDSGANEAGTPYIAMDFVEGEPLSHLLQSEGALPVSRALPIFRQVAEALSHAHEKGIVHRDLKPSNIILVNSPDRKDFVKVVDFGIAKILPQGNTDEQKLTQTGDVFGSPLYMSPEQCMGGKLDERSDIYSLGCLMYEVLTGTPPFVGNTPYETFLKHMNEQPPGLKAAVKDRSTRQSLEVILFACLAKEPEKRYQSMRRLADHMKLVEEGMHRGILARAKNWWYLTQLKRGPQRQAIPFGRFVAAMTLAICLTSFSVFLVIDLARDEPLDYYQTSLWAKIIPPPVIYPCDAVMQRNLDRGKQLAVLMLNLPGGVDALQNNALKIASELKKYGRFGEAAVFYKSLVASQLRETKGVKRIYMATTFHDYGDSLLYLNDLNGAEKAYMDEVQTLNEVYEDSPSLWSPLYKLVAIHVQKKMWPQVCKDYLWMSQLHGKIPRDRRLEGEELHQQLLPLDLCRFGDALVHSTEEIDDRTAIGETYRKASVRFGKALDLLKKSGSATGKEYYLAFAGLAKCEAFFGRKEIAIDLFHKGVAKIIEAGGNDIPLSVVYTNYADFCRAQGDYWQWLIWRTKAAFQRLLQ